MSRFLLLLSVLFTAHFVVGNSVTTLESSSPYIAVTVDLQDDNRSATDSNNSGPDEGDVVFLQAVSSPAYSPLSQKSLHTASLVHFSERLSDQIRAPPVLLV